MKKIAIPNKDYLFLEEVADKPKSKLHLPDSVQKTTFWRVAYAGPEATLPVGTVVIPSVKQSVKGRVGDDIYVVTRETELLGVIAEVEDVPDNT